MNLKIKHIFLISLIVCIRLSDEGEEVEVEEVVEEEVPEEEAPAEEEEEVAGEEGGEAVEGGDQPEAEPEETQEESIYFCNQELLISNGMAGVESPLKTDLVMCPSITDSCCTIKD